MEIDLDLGKNAARNEWVRMDEETNAGMITLELFGDPYRDALNAYDPSGQRTLVSRIAMRPQQAKAVAHALMLLAERSA